MITTDKNTASFSEKDIPQETAASTKTNGSRPSIINAEAALQEQLQDDRYTDMRADMGSQFVENLEIPNKGDFWIPGYRLITDNLAKEYGLQAAFEDDPFSDLPLDQPQPESAAINGNIVASFVDGVTGQQKADVLNSCLLAQLAANVKFDKTKDPINWTKFYANVLENVGWVIPSFSFRGLKSNQARFTMDAVIFRLLKGLLTQDQMETVQATIDAVKALETGDRRLRIFSRESTKNSAGDFLVSNVGVSANKTLSMKLGAFAFDTSSSVTNILWWQFSGNETSMQVMSTTFVLNEQVYSRVRDAILNKLGNRALNYIGGLDIGD
jgi:hypothetical protein